MRNYQFAATRLCAFALLTAGLVGQPLAAAPSARMVTYEQEGKTYYALSLMQDQAAQQAESSSIVVLMDTSASQQGLFRDSSLSALEALMQNLDSNDQVQLLAVDLNVTPLTSEFVAPSSAEIEQAIEELRKQAPLGSTDLAAALRAATDRLAFTNSAQRSIVYIGDGVSVANLLDKKTLGEVAANLRNARTSVTSFAVGPKVDAQLLAVLANHTGGNLYVQQPLVREDAEQGVSEARAQEENMRNAQVAGKRLAEWAQAEVLWPVRVNPAPELGNTFPLVMPPFRSDRDTILLGITTDELPESVDIAANLEGAEGEVSLTWTASPEASQEDHAFLAEIVDIAKTDGGASLPTLGSAGLAETARLVGARIDQLTNLAERAVAIGDHEAAHRLAQNILQADPGNARARTVQHVVEESIPASQAEGPFMIEGDIPPAGVVVEGQAPSEGVIVEEGIPLEGDISLVQPRPVVVEGPIIEEDLLTEEGLLGQVASDGAFLDQVEQERRVYAEMLSKEIQNTIVDARTEMTTNPQQAIQNLKLALENVSRAVDLDAAKRAELLDKLQVALKEARYQESLKDELDREREEALAAAREQKLINDRLEREREREKQLMARFDSLMDEQRYLEAVEVAEIVEEADPDGVTPRVASLWAKMKRHHYLQQAARAARWEASFNAWYQIELSSIPFPDNPPIVYPDPEVWEELTNRRKKYDSVDLSARSKAEERIQTALREPLKAPLEYFDTPLTQVITQLQDEYDIPIVIDTAALDELAISPETEINTSLSNVTLRSALNLMFKQPGLEDLTYTIDEEVLLITTEERANESLKVKVYPVADLVLPIQNLGIIGGGGGGLGGGGGGGGGLGGGGGGGFGGGGGGGGFGGGGGQQGGGGGGFFNVADEVETNQVQTTEENPDNETTQVEDQVSDAKPAVVRQTVRDLMKQGQAEEVIELIQTSLRNGAAQPWMYEALGIAMELAGRPKSEIERAIMSACDFSSSPEELMLIAKYLSQIDLDARALDVYQQVVKVSPLHYEAYALGLRAAQRAEDLSGIRWATVGVLSHAWPREQEAIRITAMRVAKATLEELQRAGEETILAEYQRELDQAVVRDIVVKATWSGEADVDLIVEEPGGTVCSLQNPRTTSGGVSLGDTYASYEEPDAEGFSEEYVCAKAFPGVYRVRVRKVWGSVVAGKVTIDVYQHYGAKNELHERQHIAVHDDSDALVVFELEDGRREQRLEAQRLEVAVQRQEAINRAVLAQQLGDFSDPRIIPSRGIPGIRDRLGLAGRGAVGFQPIITVLPAGTQMVANAVISPDRRYVRISASPSFTGIGNVTTFTFAGRAEETGGGGGGQGGGGGI